MITRKHYLIQLVTVDGTTAWLRNDCRHFHWTNHGKDKVYKSLAGAIKCAQKLHRRLADKNNKLNVVEVTFQPCNPELPDGFYEPVNRAVHTF
jgi:hypothetical protein